MHTALFVNANFQTCFNSVNIFNIYGHLIAHGEIGVDIFFTLSGFLIGFILFKEFDKNGSIDIFNFYRSRFLRIWPALAFYCFSPLGLAQMRGAVFTNLLFIGNLADYV